MKTKPMTVKKLLSVLKTANPKAYVRVQVLHDLNCIVVERGPVYAAKLLTEPYQDTVRLYAADDVS